MAPTRSLRGANPKTSTTLHYTLARKGISKRSQNTVDQNVDPVVTRGKRKADISPLKNDKIKRSALGNLTNNVINLNLEDAKKAFMLKTNDQNKKNSNISKKENTVGPPPPQQNGLMPRPTKIVTRAAARNAVAHGEIADEEIIQIEQQTTAIKRKDEIESSKPPTRRISDGFDKTEEESLYMSALEDIPLYESNTSSTKLNAKRRSTLLSEKLKSEIKDKSLDERISTASPSNYNPNEIPEGVVDFDKENWNDPFQVSKYAMDIFNYLKSREPQFYIEDYMNRQINISKFMRTLLVDWMVEVQETFELNHETLYLAVKLVDLYLCKVIIEKTKLQLLGAAALFIACKFDERTPPLVDDFLYICDGAYKHDELIRMEINVLKVIDFDLGIPLSYRFLRRYARCSKIPMSTLTLARYILELSLMDYSTISFSDSQMACAALYIALKMKGMDQPWDKTLEYYTGYKIADFAYIIPILNVNLYQKPKEAVKTIRKKYSHQIFHEVAKIPLLSTEKLLANTGLLHTNKP